ncbi:hypothetical protein RB195_003650 [Necator americanus]|uniref:Uncharacterized protein n=1 Tax=Necator americanus TaxID=51031 RepID=A0ABR1DQU8_NECAM
MKRGETITADKYCKELDQIHPKLQGVSEQKGSPAAAGKCHVTRIDASVPKTSAFSPRIVANSEISPRFFFVSVVVVLVLVVTPRHAL